MDVVEPKLDGTQSMGIDDTGGKDTFSVVSVSPESDRRIAHIFSMRSAPAVEERREHEMDMALELYARILANDPSAAIGGKRIFIDAGVKEQTALVLLAMLISEESLVSGDGCDYISLERFNPENPRHRHYLPPGSSAVLSGVYGWEGSMLGMTLVVDPDGDFRRNAAGDVNYARTILHELGHGATMFAPEDDLRGVYDLLTRAAEVSSHPGALVAARMMIRLINYPVTSSRWREVAADAWLLMKSNPEDWGALKARSAEFGADVERSISRLVAVNPGGLETERASRPFRPPETIREFD